VAFNGLNGLEFANALAFFNLCISTTNHCIALIRQYCSLGCHASSDYIQLQDGN
jgi:hypothetical protein